MTDKTTAKRTRRKPGVAILGFTDHREEALKLDPDEFELWGLNELYRYMDISRFDRWFEIHDRAVINPDPSHIEGLAKIELPIYMQAHYDDIPNSIPLPKVEIEEYVDSLGPLNGQKYGEYQTSSISWMIGLALVEGFEKIHVYGVDMAQDTEYAEQRPCVEWLLGIARGQGKEIYLPPTADILRAVGQYAYGFAGQGFHAKVTERLAWLEKEEAGYRKALHDLEGQYNEKRAMLDGEYNQKKNQLQTSHLHVQGAIQDCTYWKRSWAVPQASDNEGPTPDRAADPRTGIAETKKIAPPSRAEVMAGTAKAG